MAYPLYYIIINKSLLVINVILHGRFHCILQTQLQCLFERFLELVLLSEIAIDLFHAHPCRRIVFGLVRQGVPHEFVLNINVVAVFRLAQTILATHGRDGGQSTHLDVTVIFLLQTTVPDGGQHKLGLTVGSIHSHNSEQCYRTTLGFLYRFRIVVSQYSSKSVISGTGGTCGRTSSFIILSKNVGITSWSMASSSTRSMPNSAAGYQAHTGRHDRHSKCATWLPSTG